MQHGSVLHGQVMVLRARHMRRVQVEVLKEHVCQGGVVSTLVTYDGQWRSRRVVVVMVVT